MGGSELQLRQTPGMSYRVLSQNEERAVLEYQYLCPYCMRKTAVQSFVYPADYERLETGGFCDTLTCSECCKPADVRFWHVMRIDCCEKENS